MSIARVVEAQEVDGHKFPELRFVAVIEPRVLEHFEHMIVAHGDDAGAAPAGDVAECMRENVLPTSTGPTVLTWACASRKRSVASSLSSARSKVTFAVLSQRLKEHVGIQVGFLDTKRDGEAVASRGFVAGDLQQDPEAAASADGPA